MKYCGNQSRLSKTKESLVGRTKVQRNWNGVKEVKVKCTLVQSLTLCAGRTARRGIRSIALLFLDHGTRRGEGPASTRSRSLPPGKTRYPFYRRLEYCSCTEINIIVTILRNTIIAGVSTGCLFEPQFCRVFLNTVNQQT